ncbi:TPA: SIR2 family protein, partial [Escherichia coli O103:H2]
GEAPTWKELLKKVCSKVHNAKQLEDTLFPDDKPPALSLEEAAQILSLKLNIEGKSIYDEIVDIISPIQLGEDISNIKDFFQKRTFRVITTNYDKLAEYLTGDEEVQSITPGLPIPKYPSKVKIYHVHGSIDSPQNMIVTSEDYFRFINSDTYFSRKLSTMLHENTVAILGYSLSDTNLKAIINDYKIFSKGNALCSNIFFISRSEVSQDMKDYYFYCFGIRVIDNTEIDSFFKRLSINIMLIEGVIARARQSIKRVLSGTFNYKDEYLRLEDSFYQITSSIISEGFDWNDGQVVDFFKRIIKQKRDLTRESGAWEQYEQLAKWLIYFGSLLEIGGTKYENEYLDAVEYSMSNMSKEMRLGYSWHAYRAWETRWSTIIASNRLIIKKRIEEIGVLEDANSIVKDIV